MSKKKTGVVFDEEDYAGLFSRILIIVVDLLVIYLLFIACDYADSFIYSNYSIDAGNTFLYLPLLLAFFYLTLLKASKYGTAGQLLTKTKILNLGGKRPNIFQMTYRLLFWIAGPFNFLFDFAWISLNKEKRTLRDSICNTIVVKKNAIPISSDSELRNIRAMVFGFHFLYYTAKP